MILIREVCPVQLYPASQDQLLTYILTSLTRGDKYLDIILASDAAAITHTEVVSNIKLSDHNKVLAFLDIVLSWLGRKIIRENLYYTKITTFAFREVEEVD